MRNLYDLFFIYLEALVRGRLPLRYKGTYNLDDFWVIHYDVISSTTDLNMTDIINNSVHTRLMPLKQKYLEIQSSLTKRESEIFNYNKMFADTLKSCITINAIIKNKDIFFKNFKLQDYSEYKSERRNSIINNLLN